MLELRTTCEHCEKSLPPESNDAMICSYECTFCEDCVSNILHNVCPNCTGGFQKRPVRPSGQLKKYPASQKVIHQPVDLLKQKKLIRLFEKVPAESR